jgi:hypothetical protein
VVLTLYNLSDSMNPSHSSFPWTSRQVDDSVQAAVKHYWAGRLGQATRQQEAGASDTGSRSEVTGGQHLNGFVDLICDLVRLAGYEDSHIRFKAGVEIPGFYRPTKKWDVVVYRNERLCAAVELKSQVGPSFGNNFNNRTEEALGNSVDLWRAFQAGVLGAHPPWLGYLFFLEDAPGSTRPVGLAKAVFEHDPVFNDTSYADRYRILCQRMVLERHYNAATLLMSPRSMQGTFREPSPDLRIETFLKSLFGHLIGCL